jgi:hypothetical protein
MQPYSQDYPTLLVSYMFFHIEPQMDSCKMMLDAHCNMQTLLSVDNPPS